MKNGEKVLVWDSRYPDRLGNIQFHPFPKPPRNLEKCMKWIRLCGLPHQQLSVDKLRNHSTGKHIYVCSKVTQLYILHLFNCVAQSLFYFVCFTSFYNRRNVLLKALDI